MAVCSDIIDGYAGGGDMFVSVVCFPIGGFLRRIFTLRPTTLGGRWVGSGDAVGEVHQRVRRGECEVNYIIVWCGGKVVGYYVGAVAYLSQSSSLI